MMKVKCVAPFQMDLGWFTDMERAETYVTRWMQKGHRYEVLDASGELVAAYECLTMQSFP